MTLEWYCKIMGEVWGPMSAQELVAVARRGRLTRNDTVRRGPDGNWVRAELVKGLFEPAPVSKSPTAPSATLAIPHGGAREAEVGGRSPRPRPAKRSVAIVPLLRFWVRTGSQMAGPYSEPQVRQLAAEGKLKPHFLLSKDRRRWVRAGQVKGLTFGGASSETPTTSMSARATVWPLTEMVTAPQSADVALHSTEELVTAGRERG